MRLSPRGKRPVLFSRRFKLNAVQSSLHCAAAEAILLQLLQLTEDELLYLKHHIRKVAEVSSRRAEEVVNTHIRLQVYDTEEDQKQDCERQRRAGAGGMPEGEGGISGRARETYWSNCTHNCHRSGAQLLCKGMAPMMQYI